MENLETIANEATTTQKSGIGSYMKRAMGNITSGVSKIVAAGLVLALMYTLAARPAYAVDPQTLTGAAGDRTNYLEWTADQDPMIRGYNIWGNVGGEPSTLVFPADYSLLESFWTGDSTGIPPVNGTQYHDTPTTNGIPHTYVVQSENFWGETAESNTLTLNPDTGLDGVLLTVVNGTATSADLEWNNSSTNPPKWDVYASTTLPFFPEDIVMTPVNTGQPIQGTTVVNGTPSPNVIFYRVEPSP